jgi:hypothetical protein
VEPLKNAPKTNNVSMFVKFGSKKKLFLSGYLDAKSSETRKRPGPMKALGAYLILPALRRTVNSPKAIKRRSFTNWAFQRALAAYTGVLQAAVTRSGRPLQLQAAVACACTAGFICTPNWLLGTRTRPGREERVGRYRRRDRSYRHHKPPQTALRI